MKEKLGNPHGPDFTEKLQDTSWCVRYQLNSTMDLEAIKEHWEKASGHRVVIVKDDYAAKFVFCKELI